MPKIHDISPLRAIVHIRGITTYEVVKELDRVLRPLVRILTDHIGNIKDFEGEIHNIQHWQGECISS